MMSELNVFQVINHKEFCPAELQNGILNMYSFDMLTNKTELYFTSDESTCVKH